MHGDAVHRLQVAGHEVQAGVGAWSPLQVGERVQYWAASKNRFLVTVVSAVNHTNQSVQLACKPNAWIDVPQQRVKIVRSRSHLHGAVRKISDLDGESKRIAENLQHLLREGCEQELERVSLANFDSFHSGESDSIDLQQFTALCATLNKKLNIGPPDPAIVQKLFHSYDIDDNGTIERTEFPTAFRRLLRWVLASFNVLEVRDLVKTNLSNLEEKYDLGERLGQGAMGVAYSATERATGRRVVVKVNKEPTDREEFDKVRDLSHPNVIKVIELFTKPRIAIVSEFCEGGDLFRCLEYCHAQHFPISHRFLAHVMASAMRGVHYLHATVRICHNDLKPDNIFLDRRPTAAELATHDFPRFVIADFGLARAEDLEVSGDPRYKPPEFYTRHDRRATKAADIWALGVTQFELLSGGRLIYTNHRNLSQWNTFVKFEGGALYKRFHDGICGGADPDWREIAGSSRAEDLTKKLLAREPRARIGLQQALDHPYLAVLDDASVADEVVRGLALRSNMTNLKMTLLNMVALKLHGDAVAHFEQLWDKFDLDKKGLLTEGAFVRVARSYDPSMDDATAREIFRSADLDASEGLDFREFMALMANTNSLSHEQLAEAFKSMFFEASVRGDGKVNVDAFLGIFPSAVQEHRKGIQELFNQIDKSHDGYIDQNEFVAYIDSI